MHVGLIENTSSVSQSIYKIRLDTQSRRKVAPTTLERLTKGKFPIKYVFLVRIINSIQKFLTLYNICII